MTLTKKKTFIFLCVILGIELLRCFAEGNFDLSDIFLPSLTILLTAIFIGKTDKILLLPTILFGLSVLSGLPTVLDLIGDLVSMTEISFHALLQVIEFFLFFFLFLMIFIACLRRLVVKRSPVGSALIRVAALLLLALLVFSAVCSLLGIQFVYYTGEERFAILRDAENFFFDFPLYVQIDYIVYFIEMGLFYIAIFSLVPAILRPKENTEEIEKALRKLQDLYDRDVISKEEYAIKKSQLLNLE